MKKVQQLLIGTVIFVIGCLFFGWNQKSITAYADVTNLLEVKVKRVTDAEAYYYNNSSKLISGDTTINAGDYKITLYISGNTGFSATGFRIFYGNNVCRPLTYIEDNHIIPVHYKEYVWAESDLTVAVIGKYTGGEYGYNLSFGTAGTVDAVENGAFISYFVRPCRNGIDLTGNQCLSATEEESLVRGYEYDMWNNRQNHPVNPSVSNGFTIYRYDSNTEVIVGDINYDGVITASDPQLLLTLLTNNNYSINMNEYGIIYEVPDYPDVPAYYLIAVGDVNEDGLINIADAQDLLTYYSLYVAGNISGYDGIIGTENHLYVPYSISFS